MLGLLFMHCEHHGFQMFSALAKGLKAVMLPLFNLSVDHSITLLASDDSELTFLFVLSKVFSQDFFVATEVLTEQLDERALFPVLINFCIAQLLMATISLIFALDCQLLKQMF